MSLRRKWKTWRAAPSSLRGSLLEAVLLLLIARLLVIFFLRWSLPWLLLVRGAADQRPPIEVERELRRVIRMAAKGVPWKSICLPNAIAAKLMLARRGYSSTIHLGVGQQEGILHAHAWLEAGGLVITGAEGMHQVVPFSADRPVPLRR